MVGHHFTLLAGECMQLLHVSLSASYLNLINRLSSLYVNLEPLKQGEVARSYS